MATLSAGGPSFGEASVFGRASRKLSFRAIGNNYKHWTILAAIILFSSLAIAQGAPQITGVEPATGKANDTVTLSGNNLGKASVSSVYLSNDKDDFKATIVDQGDDKITMKVPQVKPGDYNVSLQVGDKLFIKPVKFKVE
jgi:IPT/TIG domain-containing protein